MREVRSDAGKHGGYSIRSLLLVLLMLGGQATLASHQALHESSAELSACVTCLASNAFEDLLRNNDDGPSQKITHVTPETDDHPVPANRTITYTTIRAPPSSIS